MLSLERKTCLAVVLINQKLTYAENSKSLNLNLDGRLTWKKSKQFRLPFGKLLHIK